MLAGEYLKSLIGHFRQNIVGPAVRALRLTDFLDRQIDLGMRVPEVHTRHRAGQRQVVRLNLVFMLYIGRDQVLIHSAGFD